MLFMKSKREFSLNHITIESIQQVIFKFLFKIQQTYGRIIHQYLCLALIFHLRNFLIEYLSEIQTYSCVQTITIAVQTNQIFIH